MPTSRRTFLGRLGLGAATVALYSVDGPPIAAKDKASIPYFGPAKAQYVIKNDSEKPMVVHYAATQPDGYEQPHARERYRRTPAPSRSTSAILLPGEELTITAVEMQTT